MRWRVLLVLVGLGLSVACRIEINGQVYECGYAVQGTQHGVPWLVPTCVPVN